MGIRPGRGGLLMVAVAGLVFVVRMRPEVQIRVCILSINSYVGINDFNLKKATDHKQHEFLLAETVSERVKIN